MKQILVVIFFLLSNAAHAEKSTAETRPVSKEEIQSFDSFYAKRHPEQIGTGVNFLVTRDSPKKKWDIKARVLLKPEHGYKNLCKQDINNYFYDARSGWREDGEHAFNHKVWLDAGSTCQLARYVELETPLPDVDVIELLKRGDGVLKQASILLRGNSDCSLIYLAGLKLDGIGTASFHHEEMLEFRYIGQQDIPVTLSVRRLGTDFTTWDMHCPIPGR
ncbi:MAG TPA: hypothetical protein VIF60_00380 [Burkholderiaceae bacterium]|jgi:hypothetical protein